MRACASQREANRLYRRLSNLGWLLSNVVAVCILLERDFLIGAEPQLLKRSAGFDEVRTLRFAEFANWLLVLVIRLVGPNRHW
jgi:hypothetical protein